MKPVVLRMRSESRIAGCVVYLIVAPVVMAIAGGAVFGLTLLAIGWAQGWNLRGNTEVNLSGAVGGLAAIATVVALLLHHRREASVRLVLWPDRVQVGARELPFARLVAIQHVESLHPDMKRLVLRDESGPSVAIRSCWPLDQVLDHLKRHAFPAMMARWKGSLARGESIEFRESRARRWWSLVGGVLAILVGGALIAAQALRAARDRIIILRAMTLGGACGVVGVAMVSRFFASGGPGLAVTRTGVRRVGDFDELAWGDVEEILYSDAGLKIVGGGRTLRLGAAAGNYALFEELADACRG